MKKILPFLFLLFLGACNQCPTDPAIANEIDTIENLLESYVIALENEDFNMIEQSWAANDSIILIGTDSHEKLMGWENIRKAYLNQFNSISNTLISTSDQFIRISCTGNTAWFTKTMNYNFMYDSVAHSFEGIRFTGVLDKNDKGQWKLMQGHLSIPAQINIGK
jgi:ketosteroid isomerase-like protein